MVRAGIVYYKVNKRSAGSDPVLIITIAPPAPSKPLRPLKQVTKEHGKKKVP
jgi:hypothetical protein